MLKNFKMEKPEFILQIKSAIANDIDKGIDAIERKIKQDSNKYDELLILKARFNTLRRDEYLAVRSIEEIDLGRNRLVKDLLMYCDSLLSEHFFSENDEIESVIKQKEFGKNSKFFNQELHLHAITNAMANRIEDIKRLFKVDLEAIPDSSCIEFGDEINSIGDTVKLYSKKLLIPEFGLFDELLVRQFNENSRNIFFLKKGLSQIDFNIIETVINSLFKIMGVDDYGKREFNADDIADYLDANFYVLFGRNWREYPKNIPAIALTIDHEEDEISLGIWGI